MDAKFGNSDIDVETKMENSTDIQDSHGGWQYKNRAIISKYHYSFDEGFGQSLMAFFKDEHIADIGAGVGQLGYFLRKHNSSVNWIGYDGGTGVKELSGQRVSIIGDPDFIVPEIHWMDAAVPVTSVGLVKGFDWVISIEVGEHIPKRFESVFLDNLVKMGRKGVVLSWAVANVTYKGYKCHLHVNEQSNEYIIKEMENRGGRYDKMWSDRFRESVKTLPWLRNTIMLFWL